MRLNRPRFYVYQLIYDGEPLYIGKGSGARLRSQERAFGLCGNKLAEFWREKDAYAFEVKMISELSPWLNKHVGGNGSTVTKKREPVYKWQREMAKIGTRAYAARILLACSKHYYFEPSKIEQFRRVAYEGA